MPSVEERYSTRLGATRYFVRVRDPRTGKFTSRTFATRPEADRLKRDIDNRGAAWALDEMAREAEENAEPTLDDWAKIHFSAMPNASPGTVARYRRIYAARWSPRLGTMQLSRITRVDVATALAEQTGSDKTVENAWGVLSHMLSRAARDGYIPRSPCADVTPGRRTAHEEVEHRFLTREEFWRVLDATPEHWRPLVMMLGGTGMRWGEAAALTVGDVDVAAATVRVSKAERPDPTDAGKRIIGPTKTKQSKRTITLPPEVVDALRPLLNRPRSARVFLPPRGGELRHRTFYVNIWREKCLAGAKLDDPQPRLHDLRHSHVAWLIAAGAPLPVIQRRLGHSTIATTNDVYGHLLPDVQRAAAEAASLVFQRPAELE